MIKSGNGGTGEGGLGEEAREEEEAAVCDFDATVDEVLCEGEG